MITNKKTLLSIPNPYKKRRKVLLNILEKVFKEIDPEHLTKKALLKENSFGKYENIYVIAIGKAGAKMAKATRKVLKGKIKKGIGVISKKTKYQKLENFKFYEASHPIPCKKGEEATKKILKLASKTKENDLVIILLSGGGSALMPAPIDGITLKDKMEITNLLLKSNATINEINAVRRQLSKIKGGKLAEALYPANILCLSISDVVGNDPAVIASGPVTPNPTTKEDALKIIKKYKIKAAKHIIDALKKTKNKQTKEQFKHIKYIQIADHFLLLKTAEKIAKELKLKTNIVSKLITGEAKSMAKKLVGKNKSGLLIAAGETTVKVKGNGQGGRNQELVLAALTKLKDSQTIVSIGTDGVDGMTPKKVAGAIADTQTLKKSKENPLDYLKANDSYNYFNKTKNLIITGPTGNNIGDLIMLLNEK